MSAAKRDERLLGFFWQLSSADAEERAVAASALEKYCVDVQSEWKGDGHSPALEYSLRRLVRGLGSSRAGARLGYAVALTRLLRSLSLDGSEIFTQLEREMRDVRQHQGGARGEVEQQLGMVFGVGVLVRSGRKLPAAVSERAARALVAAAEFKSYLRAPACAVLCDLGVPAGVRVPGPKEAPEWLIVALARGEAAPPLRELDECLAQTAGATLHAVWPMLAGVAEAGAVSDEAVRWVVSGEGEAAYVAEVGRRRRCDEVAECAVRVLVSASGATRRMQGLRVLEMAALHGCALTRDAAAAVRTVLVSGGAIAAQARRTITAYVVAAKGREVEMLARLTALGERGHGSWDAATKTKAVKVLVSDAGEEWDKVLRAVAERSDEERRWRWAVQLVGDIAWLRDVGADGADDDDSDEAEDDVELPITKVAHEALLAEYGLPARASFSPPEDMRRMARERLFQLARDVERRQGADALWKLVGERARATYEGAWRAVAKREAAAERAVGGADKAAAKERLQRARAMRSLLANMALRGAAVAGVGEQLAAVAAAVVDGESEAAEALVAMLLELMKGAAGMSPLVAEAAAARTMRDVVRRVARATCALWTEAAVQLLLEGANGEGTEDVAVEQTTTTTTTPPPPQWDISEASDGDDDESGDVEEAEMSDLSDDALLAMDAHLARMFETERKRKRAEAERRREAEALRARVLECVEVWWRKTTARAAAANGVLRALVRVDGGEALVERVCASAVPSEGVRRNEATETVKEAMRLAAKGGGRSARAAAAAKAALWVARAVGGDAVETGWVTRVAQVVYGGHAAAAVGEMLHGMCALAPERLVPAVLRVAKERGRGAYQRVVMVTRMLAGVEGGEKWIGEVDVGGQQMKKEWRREVEKLMAKMKKKDE